MKYTMRKLNDLIEALEEKRFSVFDSNDKREVQKVDDLNEHLDFIINQIKTIYGANETLGGKLSKRTRNAILSKMIDLNEITYEKGSTWWDWAAMSLTRYHLRIAWEERDRTRNLGEVGIGQLKKALGM